MREPSDRPLCAGARLVLVHLSSERTVEPVR
jgi:hypothetical protein